jgi:exopolysaccharide biosynthesis polyprenyl glycosylphosphotransferase
VSEASLSAESQARPKPLEAPARPTWQRPARGTPIYHPAHGLSARRREGRAQVELFAELRRATDTGVALLMLGVSLFLATRSSLGGAGFSVKEVVLLGCVALAWPLVFHLVRVDRQGDLGCWLADVPGIAAAVTCGGVTLIPVTWWADSMGPLLVSLPLMVVGTVVARAALRTAAARTSARTSSRILIVGSGPMALDLHRRLSAESGPSYELVGFVDSAPHIRFGEVAERFVGTLDDLDSLLMHTVVDEVLIALPIKSQYDEVQRVIGVCERAGIQARYSADIFHASLGGLRYRPSGAQPAISVQVAPDDYRLSLKRALDILGSAAGLLMLAPLLIGIALAIKVTSPGPVFFTQERYGWRKRRFRILKFRTMVEDAAALHETLEDRNELGGPVFKIRNDPRVTRLGRILRKTSMDELPQLWNVLRGEMSLVGPRPLAVRDVHRFDESWLMRRFSVVPGMTGLWQVSGRNNVGFADWAALDLEYIDRWSLGLDLRILWRTLPAVVNGVGAH